MLGWFSSNSRYVFLFADKSYIDVHCIVDARPDWPLFSSGPTLPSLVWCSLVYSKNTSSLLLESPLLFQSLFK